MLNVGLIIAAAILAVYVILGPLVLLGFYVFFDRMAEKEDVSALRKPAAEDKDPDLWTARDVREHLKRKRRIQAVGSDERL